MLTLNELLERLEKARGGVGRTKYWVGSTPDARRTGMATAIAAQVGYNPPDGAMMQMERPKAALALSFLAANELGGPSPSRPREGLVAVLRQAFSDLAVGAEFYSNGDWGEAWRTPRFSATNISQAKIDGGVLGYDAYRAFIFWVEED